MVAVVPDSKIDLLLRMDKVSVEAVEAVDLPIIISLENLVDLVVLLNGQVCLLEIKITL